MPSSQEQTADKSRGPVEVTVRGAGSVLSAVYKHALMPALEKLIPQGASELANALFQGHAYMPYGTTQRPVDMPEDPGYGVHGPEKTPEELARERVDLEEATAAERKERQVSKEVSDMSPEEQTIARNFRGVDFPDYPDNDLER
jgi:hypothetical protein